MGTIGGSDNATFCPIEFCHSVILSPVSLRELGGSSAIKWEGKSAREAASIIPLDIFTYCEVLLVSAYRYA